MFKHLPDSFLQMNTIFISIMIEALPFVLIGVFIASFIQMFISEKFIAKVIPKNKFLAVISGSMIGVLFPSCECGIVPIVRNLLRKGVPLHAGIAFMLTAPIINPVVLFSTYVAFGSQWEIPVLRVIGSLVVAVIVGSLIAYVYKGDGLKEKMISAVPNVKPKKKALHFHGGVEANKIANSSMKEDNHCGCGHLSCAHQNSDHTQMSLGKKLWHTAQHAIDEFFSMGKYLIVGSLIAALMQTYIKTSTLVSIGHGPVLSILLMMALAFILSLCSEADAFIGASFRSTFSSQSIVAFLVFGPMLDIKNVMMMVASFKTKFVLFLIASVSIITFIYALFI